MSDEAQPGGSVDAAMIGLEKGRVAGAAAQAIADELDDRSHKVEMRIYRILNATDQILDPQQAVQAWIEMHEIQKLRRALTRRERRARQIAATVGERMSFARAS